MAQQYINGFTIGVFVWLIGLTAGFSLLSVYSNTPGEAGPPPNLYACDLSPELLQAFVSPAPYHLVMAIHPKCPCTRASVAELERLIAKSGEGLTVSMLVFRPTHQHQDWHNTDLYRSVSRLPHTQVILDDDGQQAQMLNLKTSGAVILYKTGGEAVFHGGLTIARGHEGDNIGSDSILSYVRTGKSQFKNCSVYGCPLVRPEDKQQEDALVAEAGGFNQEGSHESR